MGRAHGPAARHTPTGLPTPSASGSAEIGGATGAVAFGRGDRLYLGTAAGTLREVSARTLRVRRTWPAPGAHDQPTDHRSPGGDRLVAGGDRGQLAVDLRDDRVLWSPEVRRPMGRLPPAGRLDKARQPATAGRTRDRSWCATSTAGERAGRVLEPQLGSDRIARRDGAGLTSCWRSAARGRSSRPGTSTARVSAASSSFPAGVATGGYDPTGRLLLVTVRIAGASEVVDADTGSERAASAACRATPSGSRRTRWECRVDDPSWSTSRRARCARSVSRARPRRCTPSPAGRMPGRSHVTVAPSGCGGVSLSTGQVTTTITVDGVRAVRLVSDGTSLFVTSKGANDNWGTGRYDVASGARARLWTDRPDRGWRSSRITPS